MRYFLCFIALFLLAFNVPEESWADSANYHGTVKRARGSTKADTKYQKNLDQVFDTKLFHDSYYVYNMMSSMDGLENKKDQASKEINLGVVLDSQDVNTWNQTTQKMPLKVKNKSTTDEILKDPKGSYVKMVMAQEVPALSQQTVEQVSDVDTQPISDLLIMVTESGTDVGAKPVPVELKNSNENKK